MRLNKSLLPFLTLVVLALASQGRLNAQTYRIGGVDARGVRTYIEVYEYDYVNQKPTFPGGDAKMVSFINETREYPAKAYHDGVEGRVTCSFIVNADGSISHVRVLRRVEPSLDQEAVRILKQMPPWVPGRHEGRPVPVRVIYAVAFRK